MSSIESIILWLCFGALIWLLLGLVSIKDGINKLLVENVDLRARLESHSLKVSDLSEQIRKISEKKNAGNNQF